MTRINILDEMREVAYAIDYYKMKSKDNKNMVKKYYDLQFEDIKNMFERKVKAQKRLVRILEIRFEKLKQQL